MQPRERSGFDVAPSGADVVIEAWSSTMEGCLAEAVRGYVACFATVDTAQPAQRAVDFACDPAPEPRLLVELLRRAMAVVDEQDGVPVSVTALRTPEGGVAGAFGVTSASTVDVFGAVPREVVDRGLTMAREDGGWRCQVAVR